MEKKVIPISAELHQELKDYCQENGLVMSKFIEKILKATLEKEKESERNSKMNKRTVPDYSPKKINRDLD